MQTEHKFGKIEFHKSTKARKINVRILSDGLKVTLPFGATTDEALKFIRLSENKITSVQEKLKKNKCENNYLLSENITLKTYSFDVIFKKSERKDIFFSFSNMILTIDFPKNIDSDTENSQKKCWKGIAYFLRKEALRLLPYRTQELANEHGFAFSSIKIQSSRTRWGSCSRYKSINLSLFLMLLPAHLIDYVILHELCHTREMNHSSKFWAEMDRVTKNKSKILRAELRNYKIPEL